MVWKPVMLVCQEIVNIRKYRITRSKMNALLQWVTWYWNYIFKDKWQKPVIMLRDDLIIMMLIIIMISDNALKIVKKTQNYSFIF